MFEFTQDEKRDLTIGFVALTICFAIATAGLHINAFISCLPLVCIGVAIGSILHELGHKFVAMKYHCQAEFKLWPLGLLIAFATSFFGVVFASPVSVHIHPENISDEIKGKISIADPSGNEVTANKNGNGVAGLDVRTIDGVVYAAVVVPGSGISLFEIR